MVGDMLDMLARLKMVLPNRWFGDVTPVLDAVLSGLAAAWSSVYGLLDYVKAQTRVGTASDVFLDIASGDYFGGSLPRRAGEADAAFRLRLQQNLLAPRATRASLMRALLILTGREPAVFEPFNATDTGGYNAAMGYGVCGGYGSIRLPLQFFVTVFRPNATPVSNGGGYVSGPGGYDNAPMFYASSTMFASTLSDAEIYQTVAGVLPTCGVAWTRISN